MLAPPRGGLRPAAGQHGRPLCIPRSEVGPPISDTQWSTVVYPATRGGLAELGYTTGRPLCIPQREAGLPGSDTHWSTVVYPDRKRRASFAGYTMVDHVSGPDTRSAASPALLRSSRPSRRGCESRQSSDLVGPSGADAGAAT